MYLAEAPLMTFSHSMRGAVDSLVQSSLVQLFSAYEVAVAPLPRGRAQISIPEVSAAVSFVRRGGAGKNGRIVLSMPASVLDLMKSGAMPPLQVDWARELANQLAGRIKNRLLQFSIALDVGISTTVDSKSISPPPAFSMTTRTYSGRTLRGEVIVTVTGLPEDSELVYCAPKHVVAEGQALLF